MKNICLFSAILLVCLFSACGNDDDVSTLSDGPLILVEKALEDVFYEWTEIVYDENQRILEVDIQFENVQENTYLVQYEGGDISFLTVIVNYQTSGNLSERDYTLTRQGDEIMLMPVDEGAKYLFHTSDGYIDLFRAYFGPNDEYYNETVFTRDAENNIETIAYFATDATSTDLKVYEYSYSDHSNEFELPAAFNPVMDFSFTGYEANLGTVLGLKISNKPPMKSTYWDAGGTFRADNITANPVVENGKLRELSYQDLGTGNDNYLIKLTYE